MFSFRRFLLLSIPILFLPSCSLFKADIKEIDSLTQVENELHKMGKNDLVVFDMDHTIINPQESVFNLLYEPASIFDSSDQNFIKEIRTEWQALRISKGENYFNKLLSAVWEKTFFKPVESNTVPIIKDLQNRGIKVIALTSSNTGKFGVIENMQQWRLSNLHQVGLDFSASFELQETEFKNLPPQFGFHPIFYKGILCSAGNPKGKMLAAFLEKIGFQPKKILFFDDNIEQCKSVDREMKKLSISVQCYCYRAAFKNKIKLNQKVVRYQSDHWIEQEAFIPEKEVLEMLSDLIKTSKNQ